MTTIPLALIFAILIISVFLIFKSNRFFKQNKALIIFIMAVLYLAIAQYFNQPLY